MPVLTEDRPIKERETQIPLEKPKPLEGPEMLGYTPPKILGYTADDVYRLNTPYKEGQRLQHYLRPIEQPRHMEQMDEEELINPYSVDIRERTIGLRPIIPRQYMHMFPYHADNGQLGIYEQYKLPPKRPSWVDKEVRLYSYQVPWFATAMTDGKTVWLGPRGEVYFPFPEFRINHEDPGHPMTFIPGWTEDDVDIKGQIYASVRSSNRVYKV